MSPPTVPQIPDVIAFVAHPGAPIPSDLTRHTIAAETDPAPRLEVLADGAQRVMSHRDHAGRSLYVWGRAACDKARSDQMLSEWLADATPERLREVVGSYVLLIDDHSTRRVAMASDVLGFRPWYAGRSDGRMVAGNSVLGLARRGLAGGAVRYESIAAWLRFNFDFTPGLLIDVPRLERDAITWFDYEGNVVAIDRAPPSPTEPLLDADEIAEAMYDLVVSNFELLTDGEPSFTLPLSGGYDSRYLLGLAMQQSRKVALIHVETSPAEATLAREVAAVAGQSIEVIPSGGHSLDAFDAPFAISPGGFPTGRNIATLAVGDRPEPVLSGFIGGWFMRDVNGRPDPADDLETIVETLVRSHAFRVNRSYLLRHDSEAAIDRRLREALRSFITSLDPSRNPYADFNLFGRQRHYVSSLWQQHLGTAEVLLPFVDWRLVDLRGRAPLDRLTQRRYGAFMARKFPQFASIAHSKDVDSDLPEQPSRHLRRATIALTKDLFSNGRLTDAVSRKKVARRIPDGLRRQLRRQDELLSLYKIKLFVEAIDNAGLKIDWRELAR